MNKNSVAVIGQGFVGGSLTTVLAERGVDVYAFDKAGKYATGALKVPSSNVELDPDFPKSVEELAYKTEDPNKNVYFVCLPTPMKKDGSADLSIVEGILSELANVSSWTTWERIAVIKSTVPPGTVQKWNEKFNKDKLYIIHNPEFLREATAIEDMRNQDRIILGGPEKQANIVKRLYNFAFPEVPCIVTTSNNSELTKYMINCFLAMKVSFANEIYQYCAESTKNGIDLDYNEVVKCAKIDKRLGESHWKVPSFEKDDKGNDLFGFSLSCFPKDVNALMNEMIKNNVKPTMLQATWEKNLEVRPGKDWIKMKGRAVSEE